MQEWLREHGPVDGEDLERHDKWLCMMWPRLHLLKELLADDGVIFVSIDDNEQHHLRVVMDEVFGQGNFGKTIIWKKRGGPPNEKKIGSVHEYVVLYSVNMNLDDSLNRKERSEEIRSRYQNPDNHPKGPWAPGSLMANVKGGRYVASLRFPIVNPNTGQEHYPGADGNWRFNRDTIVKLLDNDEIYFGRDGTGRPTLKRFLAEAKGGVPHSTIWNDVPLGLRGSREIEALLGSINAFDTAKPEGLIRQALKMATQKDAIVLDAFAGSGTTAHATLALNREDGGNRRFILVECEEYADTITAERVRRVIDGVPNARDTALRDGLGGSFTYCTLGDPIDAEGLLRGERLPDYETLAAYLLHTAAGAAVDPSALRVSRNDGRFYRSETTDYYLFYEPDLERLRSDAAMLTDERARQIATACRAEGRQAIVFGAGKYLGQRELTDMRITFSQLPYELFARG